MKHDTDSHSRLIVATLVPAMLTSLAGGVWFFRLQQQAIKYENEKNLGAIARIKADQIIAWQKDQFTDAAFLQLHPLFSTSIFCFTAEESKENKQELIFSFPQPCRPARLCRHPAGGYKREVNRVIA